MLWCPRQSRRLDAYRRFWVAVPRAVHLRVLQLLHVVLQRQLKHVVRQRQLKHAVHQHLLKHAVHRRLSHVVLQHRYQAVARFVQAAIRVVAAIVVVAVVESA